MFHVYELAMVGNMDRNIDERRGQVENPSAELKTVLVNGLSVLTCEENGINSSKSRSSSTDSIYEIIAEEDIDASDNEVCNDQSGNHSISVSNENVEFSRNNSTKNVEESEAVYSEKGEDNTDCNSMDEEFVIVDDASDVQEEKAHPSTDKNASDSYLEMDAIIDEFAEEENKDHKVLKVDPEDEIDSIFEEFVESEKKICVPTGSSELPTVVSAEGDKEIETLLDAFKEQNDSDDDCLIIENDNASDKKSSNEVAMRDTTKKNDKTNISPKEEIPACVSKSSQDSSVADLGKKNDSPNSNDVVSDNPNSVLNQNKVNDCVKNDQKLPSEVCLLNIEKSIKHVEDNNISSQGNTSQSYRDVNSKELSDKVALKANEAEKVVADVVNKCIISTENQFIDNKELLSKSNSDNVADENEFDQPANCTKRKLSLINESAKDACGDDLSVVSVILHDLVDQTAVVCNSLTKEACSIQDNGISEIGVCTKSNIGNDQDVKSSDTCDSQRESAVVLEITSSQDSVKKEMQNDRKRTIDDVDVSDSESSMKKVKEDDDMETGLNYANVKKESNKILDDTKPETKCSTKIVEEANTMAKELTNEVVNFPLNVKYIYQTSKKLLNNFSAYLVMNYIESFSDEIIDIEKKNQVYQEELKSLDKSFEKIKATMSDFVTTQQATFQKHNFKNKVVTRTVGVNVKIYKNSSLPNSRHVTLGYTASNSEEVDLKSRTASSNAKMLPELSQKNNITITPVNELNKPVLALPMQFARRMPSTPLLSQARRPGAPPNATTNLSGEMVPVFRNPGSKIVTNPQQMVVFSNTVSTPPRGQLDLTAEEIANRKATVTTQSYVPASSSGVAKVLTGVNSNQNVLVPFSNLLLQRPVIPQLPPNMIGARTLTYIVPPNSGPLSSIGGRAIPPFISSSGQRVQLVVRVTNPTSLPPASTAVNTLAKIAAASPQASTSSPNSQSPPGLVLISRTSKHPAPFPAAPTYPPNNKLKALPPKPSLKGSKAPNGIILSWNMSVFSSHADIATYQLFAYQESNGPVSPNLWKKVGDVKALPLPMACTLTQFSEGHRYYFTVRAVDTYSRFGPFSDAVTILFADGDPPANH